MFRRGRSGSWTVNTKIIVRRLIWKRRTVDQSEGGKTVGVDPTVITARKIAYVVGPWRC